jgi:hypothetical protein
MLVHSTNRSLLFPITRRRFAHLQSAHEGPAPMRNRRPSEPVLLPAAALLLAVMSACGTGAESAVDAGDGHTGGLTAMGGTPPAVATGTTTSGGVGGVGGSSRNERTSVGHPMTGGSTHSDRGSSAYAGGSGEPRSCERLSACCSQLDDNAGAVCRSGVTAADNTLCAALGSSLGC